MAAFDFKKQDKQLYPASEKPCIIDVPEMLFLTVEGAGDPNTAPAYQSALAVLYGLSYAIKMSKMTGTQPEGYFDYVVPPLEGLWWVQGTDGFDGTRPGAKDQLCWLSIIRQPSFVTEEALTAAKASLLKKKPQLDTSAAQLRRISEGLCGQILHIGSYDDEPATITRMDAFLKAEGFRTDFTGERKHHEIYLGDPRKTAPEKLKTIIRHPIVQI